MALSKHSGVCSQQSFERKLIYWPPSLRLYLSLYRDLQCWHKQAVQIASRLVWSELRRLGSLSLPLLPIVKLLPSSHLSVSAAVMPLGALSVHFSCITKNCCFQIFYVILLLILSIPASERKFKSKYLSSLSPHALSLVPPAVTDTVLLHTTRDDQTEDRTGITLDSERMLFWS